tara:strand:+ start:1280 stop:1813 length:534 start_codon:yes stop_codon:yes gene_type:complete
MMNSLNRNSLLLPVLLLLAACTGNNEELLAVQNYVNQTVNRPPGRIEPPPEMISYEAFTYSAANLRSPFEIPIDVSLASVNQQNSNIQPDLNRPREALEGFAIGNLQMRGIMSRGNTIWALVSDANNNLHYVSEGSYMGRNHGRVVSISEQQIDLIEIVPSGAGGWIERPQSVTLNE